MADVAHNMMLEVRWQTVAERILVWLKQWDVLKQPMCGKLILAFVLCSSLLACHRTREVRGIYVSQNGEGTLFPCDEPNTAVLVPDTVLTTRYQAAVRAPNEEMYVRLRGIATRSGSIYSGRRYFVVQQVLEMRPRQSGECPRVAHPISSVFPS